ncbi:MAG: hypothetical protein IKS41_04895 [Alphaproteobacteria bacterium]|nr:hypothetical protein [Alphaproteobacteria bacterium]
MEVSKFLALGILLWAWVAKAEVVAERLPEMKVGTIGVETGLSQNIWGEKPDATQIFSQIKASGEANLNDSEKDILRRILLTDVGGVASLEEKGEEYLVARVEALMAQGMFEEALVLMDRVSPRHLSANLKQLKAKILFVSGRPEEACAENYMEAFGREEAFIRAVCADAIGVPPASALAYEVYRESGADTHPFLNAAGEVLYRDIETLIPMDEPSVWEMPVIARVWGVEALKLPLTRTHLWVLVGQEQVPHEVRVAAGHRLHKKEKKQADGQVLTHLIQMAEHRARMEEALGDMNAK